MSAKRLDGHRAVMLAVAAAGLAGWMAPPAAATTYTWTRAGANNNWDNALNWTSSDPTNAPPPPPADPLPEGAVTDVLFSGAMVSPGNTSSLRMPYTLNSITFNSDFVASGSFAISSAALAGQTSVDITLGAGGLTVHNFGQNVNINAVTLAGETGVLKLSTDQTWNIDLPNPGTGAKTVGVFRPLTGSVNLTKIGTGILILSKSNTDWTGNVILNEGQIRTGGAATDPSNHFGTGTLVHESANDVSLTASTVSNDGGGGDRTFSNNFRLGGTGQFTFGGSFAINTTSASTVTLTADDTRIAMANGSANNTYNFDAKFTGTGGFVKLGSGVLNLNNMANDYAGRTTFGAGSVVVSDPHQLGDGGAANNLVFDGGTLRITAPMSMTRSVTSIGGGTIDTGASDVTISGGMTAAGTGVLHKAGTGVLTLPHVRAGGVSVDAGEIFLTSNGGNGGTSKVGSVTTTTGTLDLNDNDMVVDYAPTDPDPTDGLRLQLKAGRDSGWTGPGIVSKAAKDNAAATTAIGYASAADVLGLSGTATSTWDGQTVDATSVLMKYTYYGDANLDGVVNADDLALADRGLATAKTGWQNGDFNYDGVVDASDFFLMDKSFAADGGALSPELLAQRDVQFGPGYVAALVAAVPEPVCPLACLFGGLLFSRRRK